MERTVLDLLPQQANAEAALGLVADALRHPAATVDRIRQALGARTSTAWRRVVLDALPDIRAGAQSVLELHDANLRRRHNLPFGERQFKRLQDGTEHLDVFIEDWSVHVEFDGHDRAREIWRDMRRDNRGVVARVWQLRYGRADMVDRPCDVAVEQAVILRRQGWPGRFTRCRRCPPFLPPEL